MSELQAVKFISELLSKVDPALSYTFITVVALIVLSSRFKKWLDKNLETRVDSTVYEVLRDRCAVDRVNCDGRFKLIHDEIKQVKDTVIYHAPNGELQKILEKVSNMEKALTK
jgi:hypothetical protein